MKYKAIIFDLYGTLVDSFSFNECKNMLSRMSIILGLKPTEFINEWLDSYEMRMLGKLKGTKENIEYICDKNGKKVSEEKVKKAVKISFDSYKKELKPRKNYIKMLNRLIGLEYKLGLISDCSYETIKVWKSSQLSKIFKEPVFSAEVGIRKPDIRIYQIACDRLNVEPGQCIYIGDGGSYELTGAANAGMMPIKIQAPHEMSDDTYKVDEDKRECRIIKSIDELFDLDLLEIEN